MAKTRRIDRLTSLPEPLIVNLIKSLPMKDAFFLCCTCKSLEHLYVYIPFLEFREKQNAPLADRSKLARCVTRFLENRILVDQDLDSPITTFTLSLKPKIRGYDSMFTNWIELLDQIGVCKVFLDFVKASYKPPPCLFNLEKPIVLKLQSCILNIPAQFPGFRSLEELQLVNVRVRDHELTFLVSKCPSLKSLKLSYCDSVRKITVLDVESKLETLCLKHCEKCSEVNVPSLRTFWYSDVDIIITLEDGTKPCTVKITKTVRMGDESEDDEEVSSMNGVLENLKHVQHLSLAGSAFTCFASGAESIMPTNYSSLVTVEVELSLTDKIEVFGLFCLLQRANHVESLTIKISSFVKMEEILGSGESLPELTYWEDRKSDLAYGCLNNLKEIHILGLRGKCRELKFVKFMADNARQLQIMTISLHSGIRGHLNAWRKLSDELPEFVKIVADEDI